MKKKYGLLFFMTAILLAVSAAVPFLVPGMVTQVELMHPTRQEFSDDIYVSGSVEALQTKEVYVDLPLVPDQVFVSIGDTVSANQVLATVDVNATRTALLNLVEAANVIPEEYISVAGLIGLDASLIETYLPNQILAPASGTVTSLALVSGTLAAPKTAVCSISKEGALRIRLTVSEEYADRVEAGQEVVFRASATGQEKYVGRVERVFPTATQTLVGTSAQTVVGLYVSLQEDYDRLKPGYTVTGVIKDEEPQSALIIPYEAVQQDDLNQEYVYVYEQGRAVRRNIVTGKELSWGVAVTMGLSEEDAVIQNASAVPGENCLVRQGH